MAFIRLYCKGVNVTVDHIDAIYQFNEQAGLLEQGYNDFSESAYQIEEALEGYEIAHGFTVHLDTPKEMSRTIVRAQGPFIGTDVDRLDKACDAVVFAIGSMTKLGLDHHAITKALNIVNDANKAKLGMSRDSEGKLLKPEGFVGPEVKLQELLDSIRK